MRTLTLVAVSALLAGCTAPLALTNMPGSPARADAPEAVSLPLEPYLMGGEEGPPPAAEGAREAELYTCSMHPDIEEAQPGSCPVCGMPLVPKEHEP